MARLASETEAAREIGLELSTFRHLVACGRIPKPKVELGGKFDMKACHAAIDRISGLEANAGGRAGNALDAWKAGRG
ncbi:MAG: hypothetical protein JNM20_12425 [Rhizobiales bacterium]|nr:hypothetical protein [Hyphomicrobiales bacterium]